MGYTLVLENGDIVFNLDGTLETTEDLAMSFKVLLETQYGSDFRNADYGLKLQEIFESTYSKRDELVELYIRECLIQHPEFDKITSIEVIKGENRGYVVNLIIQLKSKELITIEGVEVV